MAIEKKQSTPVWASVRRLLRLAGRHKVWLWAAIAINLLQTLTTVGSSHGLRRIFEAVAAGDVDRRPSRLERRGTDRADHCFALRLAVTATIGIRSRWPVDSLSTTS